MNQDAASVFWRRDTETGGDRWGSACSLLDKCQVSSFRPVQSREKMMKKGETVFCSLCYIRTLLSCFMFCHVNCSSNRGGDWGGVWLVASQRKESAWWFGGRRSLSRSEGQSRALRAQWLLLSDVSCHRLILSQQKSERCLRPSFLPAAAAPTGSFLASGCFWQSLCTRLWAPTGVCEWVCLCGVLGIDSSGSEVKRARLSSGERRK